MAKITSANLGNLTNILGKFVKNLSWLFFVIFLGILVIEAFEIKTSVQITLNAGKEPVVVSKEKGVRINFDDYDKIVQRIEAAQNFEPTGGITKNPFQ